MKGIGAGVVLAAVLSQAVLSQAADQAVRGDVQAQVGHRPLVGVNYFAGWWSEKPNKWQDPKDGHEWLPEYPGRAPLLGKFNEQETMDREIVAAATHGVDFFSILWYPRQKQGAPDQAPMLARGLAQFMASPNAKRLRFMVEFCNHPPFSVPTDTEWEECVAGFVQAMRHPSYLKVDGRAVFKIHSAYQFIKDAGDDLDHCRRRLDVLRKAAREAGVGELVIGAGAMGDVVKTNDWGAQLFDFSNEYMMVPDLPSAGKDRPYSELIEYGLARNRARAQNAIPHLPFLGAGWNPRPWGDKRAAFAFPTREEWIATLRRMDALLKESPQLGIPNRNGTVQPAFVIYAWNEFGEGGIVAPTQGDGLMKLEGIREVFAWKSFSR